MKEANEKREKVFMKKMKEKETDERRQIEKIR